MKPASFIVALIVLIAIALSIGCSGPTELTSKEAGLTASDLIAEYERLIPINHALNQGQWIISPSDYPKAFGSYKSRQVSEEFVCGDVCPQAGSVILIYSGISESDCASISGDVVYSAFWGPQFLGCSPLTVRGGTLAQNDTYSWSIVGETITTTTQQYNTRLILDASSVCRNNGAKVACTGFQTGQHAVVVGLNSGNGITVLTLDI